MYERELLSIDDVRSVFHVVQGVLDRWQEPAAWRMHLLERVCELTASSIGMISGVTDLKPTGFRRFDRLAILGMDERQKALAYESAKFYTAAGNMGFVEITWPGMGSFFEQFHRNGTVTMRRIDMSSDEHYYRSTAHQEFRGKANCDDALMTLRSVNLPSHTEMLTLDRPIGAARYSPRDAAIVKLLHDEIAPLVGVRLATEAHYCEDGLSPRLRQTLHLLLEGESEKTAAAKLGISDRTVHEYVGMIYRHFNVNTRAELMAYFIKRRPITRPSENGTTVPSHG